MGKVERISLIYGFTIPVKIWNKLLQSDIINQVARINNNYKYNHIVKDYKFGIYENLDSELVLFGLELSNLIQDSVNKLQINEMNIFFNNHIEVLQEIFAELFKPIITGWAEIIKQVADEFQEKHKDATEQVEIDLNIEIPDDLKTEWYIYHNI